MPRKPKKKHPVRELRRILGRTQRDFAQRIGISADYLKKIENRDRNLPREIAQRIHLEAGVTFLSGELRSAVSGRIYTQTDYDNWKRIAHGVNSDARGRELALNLAPWIEILFRAAAKPKNKRLWQVWQRVARTLDECREQFGLVWATDDLLREYAPPSADKITADDIAELRKAGWKGKDLPRIGDKISLAWCPGGGGGDLVPAWLGKVKKPQTR